MDDINRAVKVLQRSKWLVLGTCDEEGPWSAGVAHSFVPNTGFFQYLKLTQGILKQ